MSLDIRVYHRLALGVEPLDALTGRRPVGVQVIREDAPRGPQLLESTGTRFKLRHGPGVRQRVTLRVDDPARRWVPRRFQVALWTLADVEAADADPPAGPAIPVEARTLRPWLLPGAAWSPPRGTTGVRGRVLDAGRPAPWPRIVARDAGGALLGWAHGDDRSEFLLVVTTLGTLPPPAPSTLDIHLTVHIPAAAQTDPPLEPVPRTLTPPAPGTADEVLAGRAVPAGYRTSSAPAPVTVTVGEVLAPLNLPFVT